MSLVVGVARVCGRGVVRVASTAQSAVVVWLGDEERRWGKRKPQPEERQRQGAVILNVERQNEDREGTLLTLPKRRVCPALFAPFSAQQLIW